MRRRVRSPSLAGTLTVLVGLFTAAPAAWGQTVVPASGDGRLKVTVSCAACEKPPVIPFVVLVDASETADIDVVVSGADPKWTVAITGRGRFAGLNRTLTTSSRADLERTLKLGLAEYAAATPYGTELDVTVRRSPSGPDPDGAKQEQKDPWNYWVFRLGASSYADGEKSSSSGSYYLSTSANRTTDAWKTRLFLGRSVSRSSFDLGDGTIVKTRLTDWNVDSLVVKSLGPHWSAGATGGLVGSTFSNAKFVARLAPGIEYDIFPYSESSKRSLTFQYTAGPAHYQYDRETIFGKLSETILQHTASASLGLRQPWGQVGGSLTFTQHLTALDRTRLSFNGSATVRLFKSLTLTPRGSYSRIRDQFTLEKGDATDEEVFLRQRQLATGFRYSLSIGLGYSFGALSNATVNPRFGG
jgi:hypothetical protein